MRKTIITLYQGIHQQDEIILMILLLFSSEPLQCRDYKLGVLFCEVFQFLLILYFCSFVTEGSTKQIDSDEGGNNLLYLVFE